MKRVLLGTLAFSIVIFSLVLIFALRGLDLTFARQFIATLASEMIGREVQLEGSLNLKLGADSQLSVSEVRIANTEGAGPEPLMMLNSLVVRVRTASLLRGTPHIRLLQVDDLQLRIREFADGTTNFPVIPGSEEGSEPTDEYTLTLPFILESIRLKNVVADFQSERSKHSLQFSIEEFSQQMRDGVGLELQGHGFLDEDPWSLSGEFSDLNTLLTGQNISHAFTGHIAGLDLQAQGSFPELANPKDWKLEFSVAGSISRSLSVLSPLLAPGAQLDARLTIEDIDPGINWQADITLDDIALVLSGKADDPLKLEGARISLDARGSNLARLASAAGLGDLPPRAFSASGMLIRQGSHFEIEELVLLSGPDRLRLDGEFSNFPLTRDANLILQISGPDFSAYQSLLQLPLTLAVPYTFYAQLIDQEQGLELVTSELQLGEHLATVQGPVGGYPGYEGSDLTFAIYGPNLDQLGTGLGLAGLPSKAYKARGKALVLDGGKVSVRNLRVDVGAISAFASGELGPVPIPDSLDLNLTLKTSSLAELGELLGVTGLAPQAVQFKARAFGELDQLKLSEITMQVADATLVSDGIITLTDAGPLGNLDTEISIPDLPGILGELSPAGLAEGPYTISVTSQVAGGVATVDRSEITGPALEGTFSGRSGSGFSIVGASLQAELNLKSPKALMPSVGDYQLPPEQLLLRLTSSATGAATSITGSLEGKMSRLNVTALIPQQDNTPIQMTLSGKGTNLAAFGGYSNLPLLGVPYSAEVAATMEAETYRVNVKQLIIGATEVTAEIHLQQGDAPRLQAAIKVPRADIRYWQAGDESTENGASETTTTSTAPTTAKKLIPKVVIPVEFLSKYSGDISVITGKLGIPDPFFDHESLIDRLDVNAKLDNQVLDITLSELEGSRGKLSGSMRVELDGKLPTASIQLEAIDFPLGITASGDAIHKLPVHSLNAQFSGTGQSLRDVLGSLDGALELHGGPGVVNDIGLNMAMGSFTDQLLELLIPTTNTDPDVAVECTVLALQAHEGVVTLDPGFVMRTARMDMEAKGTIDLETEKIRVRFSNNARKGLGISASGLINAYIQIVGTLAEPSIGIDAKGAAVAGSTAVATGGLSILGEKLFDRFVSQDQPCESARDRLHENDSEKPGS